MMPDESDHGDVFFTFDGHKTNQAKTANPNSFHIRGHVKDGEFIPQSQILGEGSLEADGVTGWMELSEGKFYPFHAARTPKSPYVKGHMTEQGFIPSSREIF